MEKKSLKNTIYDDLKEKIIFCELLPGSVIYEEELCKLYNVSRTPIREVLLQLEREKYVTIVARKSTKVSKLSFQEMNEIIELRLLMEPRVIETLKGPLSPEVISQLNDLKMKLNSIALDGEMNLKKFLNVDYEFHCLLVSLGNNQLMLNFCRDILQRSIRQWYLMYVRMDGRLEIAQKEHEEIVDLLINRNYMEAAKCLEQHINAYHDLVYFD